MNAKPRLVVVVDTEEDFNWSAPFSRQNTSVKSIRFIDRVQTIFDEYGITPTYAIDYPVVSQADGRGPLLDILADGRCVIGSHLHPWVNPPFDEPVTAYNSYPGNLSPRLEAEKLKVLSNAIQEHFQIRRPSLYRALTKLI